MRYVRTGATGLIGGALARALQREGHEVVALVRDRAKAAPLAEAGFTLADGDVTDPASLRGPMRGVDGVFHLAAVYRLGTDRERLEAGARAWAAVVDVSDLDALRKAVAAIEHDRGCWRRSPQRSRA